MRQSGILMPVFSLPSPYGIGTVGQGAFEFADFLRSANIKIWQVLPAGPTGYGDSPYQSFSSFAGNPYFIDPDFLCRDGFLEKKKLPPKIKKGEKINYGDIYVTRGKMLRDAFSFSFDKIKDKVSAFEKSNPDVYDYAVFMAIKDTHGGVSWHSFPKGLLLHRRSAVESFSEKHRPLINYYLFVQYLFYTQWSAFKAYVNSLGIKLIGDMPIYVAPDSSDAWANSRNFQLDKDRRPTLVAGVPPDYFSENGQKWGNPLYDWKYLKNSGYAFWVRRMNAASKLFDIVRLDHFIGFANYYSVPSDAPDAKNGFWRDGPGMSLFRKLKKEAPDVGLVAEDLGIVNDKVISLVKKSGFPCMRVLQFAFGGGDDNIHLPSNIKKNMLVYTGTHDNAPTLSWWNGADAYLKEDLMRRLNTEKPDMPMTLIKAALGCCADTVIIPMWDWLSLGDEGRVNTPGKAEGNWAWRIKKTPCERLSAKISCICAEYRR